MAIDEDMLRGSFKNHDVDLTLSFADRDTLVPDCPQCGERYLGWVWWDTNKDPHPKTNSANRGTYLFACGRDSNHRNECYERANSSHPRPCKVVYIFCYNCGKCSFGVNPPRSWFPAFSSPV